jgi:hypothetical protein
MSKKLFMSRSDKFEDQYEGTFSEPTYEEIRKLSIDNPDFLKFYKTHREQVAISSYIMNMNRLPCGKYSRKTQRDWPSNLQ